jgi:para-aminobenzoate synthetase component I
MQAEEISYLDPVQAFAPWAAQPWSIFLDSAREDGALGKHSFICVQPCRRMTVAGGQFLLDNQPVESDPFTCLESLLGAHAAPALAGLPPFQGGAAGFIGYEMGRYLENVDAPGADDLGLPDMAMGVYDQIIAFDLHARRAWILTRDLGAKDAEKRRARLRQNLALARATPLPPAPQTFDAKRWRGNFPRDVYEQAVSRVVRYILEGDIFQANIAQRFAVSLGPGFDRFGFYRRLREVNPAPFSAFLEMGDYALASSSPERFLHLSRGRVEARPIKGTRPRGQTPEEDAALAAELGASEKDRAENVMIVDLLRNDLSRVCMDHEVEVPALCALESYASVHHLVSAVTGRLRPECNAMDALRAAFPGGSITGAPKIRAMQIIAELEPHRRGPYCGAIGYLGFDGGMDMNIAIRTVAMNARQAVFHAGGGIVADSVPSTEYFESLDKARALFAAFGLRPPDVRPS